MDTYLSKDMSTAITGSVLSDADILAELDKSVIIHPFNKNQLAPCSYDVTLGHYYWVPNVNGLPRYLNPNNGQHIFQYWGLDSKCQTLDDNGHRMYGAGKADIVTDPDQASEYGVNIGDEVIVIPPGHVILAHTQEFIGGRHNITTMLKAKSTMGRSCISICKCAGMGDPGYFNRWTLEIENHSLVPIVLRVGQRVAQVVFFRTGAVSVPYSSKGQYQKTDVLEELIKDWSPLSMIPSKGVEVLKSTQEQDL
jgi:dCTP deaminase